MDVCQLSIKTEEQNAELAKSLVEKWRGPAAAAGDGSAQPLALPEKTLVPAFGSLWLQPMRVRPARRPLFRCDDWGEDTQSSVDTTGNLLVVVVSNRSVALQLGFSEVC